MKPAIIFFMAAAFTATAQVDQIDALVMPYVDSNNFSGCIAISQDGKALVSKCYGLMNRTYNLPNTRDTRFYLASVSMIFTSAAVMELVEEKKVSLDDRVSKYLPDYRHGDRITIHHLLAQRSGIPAIGQNKNVDYDSITQIGHTCAQLIGYFKSDDLLFKPGSQYNHGRSDYIVLAYIIEKVSGQSFGAYLKEHIFDPLKIYNSGHSTGERTIVPNLAAGYAAVGHYGVENADGIDWTSKTGHASVYSTADDLSLFANAVMRSELLSRESWEKIFTDYGNQVGYGWFIRDHLDRKRVQMNGRSPGFSSYIGIYPDDKLSVVVLSNNYISLPPDIGMQLAAWLLKKTITPTGLSTRRISPEEAAAWIGKYKFDEKFYVKDFEMEVTYSEGLLFCSWGALIPAGDGKTGGSKFILRSYWSEIEFVRGSQGKVTGMNFDGFRGTRVE